MPHQPQLRCPDGPSRTPQCHHELLHLLSLPRHHCQAARANQGLPAELARRFTAPFDANPKPPQQNGEHVAGEEVNLDEQPEEPDVWEVSFPKATRLPTRGCQTRSQIATIDDACFKVARCRRPQPWCPAARRTIKGERGVKQLLSISVYIFVYIYVYILYIYIHMRKCGIHTTLPG